VRVDGGAATSIPRGRARKAGCTSRAWPRSRSEPASRYRTPSGESVAIARQSEGRGVDDFVALSSTCPHLGCQVHWEAQNERFFCPCHNGTFDRGGKGTGGPPGEAGLSLPRYPLEIDAGLLYIEVPLESLSLADASGGISRPGHDRCLERRAGERAT
jgi:nitrite reductase/ring-hydroxylating ferredoxin subunit